MDFTLGETQQAVAQAAAHALDRNPPLPDGHALWKELGQAGLLGLALPAWLGGDGLGVLDTAVLLTEVGRRAAPGPALATLAMGVLPVTRWGTRELQQALLDGVAAGDTILTAAVREPSDPMPPAPATTVRNGAVSGVKTGVQYGAAARWILVPASLASGGTAVAVVDPSAGGVRLRPAPSSAGGPEYTLHLDDAPVAHLLGDDRAVTGLYQLALAGAACLADGALAGALALTTAHVGSRKQFGRPLATFQAVAQQIADVAIVSRTLHLAALSACWRLDDGARGGRRPRRGRVLAGRPGARCAAHLPPPARRDRHGRHLPAAPVLRARQGPGQARRRGGLPPRPARRQGGAGAAVEGQPCSAT